uniref:unspecific monooxygenase n=1 Tax=Plutella xylostella TaxID=51655 RepID=A0A0A7DH58_PLUXY|nr:P450 CYP6 family protein 8 [Plutella xylostella]
MSYILTGLAIFIAFFYLYFNKKYRYWKDRNVVTPTPQWPFGNIRETVLRRTTPAEYYTELYEAFPDEKVVGIYRMWAPCLVLRHPDVIQHVLVKDFDLFVGRGVEFEKQGLGQNLFHADGDTWRVLRTKFSPIFTSGKLKQMMYLLNERADKFIERLEVSVAASQEQEVYFTVQKFTISSISSVAFGLELDLSELDTPGNVFDRMNRLIFTTNYAQDLDFAFPGLLKTLSMSLFPKPVKDFFYGMVRRVMEERNGEPSGRNDFMDLLLEMKEKKIHGVKKHEGDKERSVVIDEDVMAAQAFVFYVAGYETSASTTAFLLRLLALHPDIQQRVYEEIQRVTSSLPGPLTYESLKQMTYLKQVIDETLRMFPLVDPLQRVLSTGGYRVPGTEVTLDEGSLVLVPVRGLHYDPQYYPDPHTFDPDRFNAENVKLRHPCVYLPFGTGPRNCIGMRFAEVQTKLAVVRLLQRFRFESSPRTKAQIDFDPMKALPADRHGIFLNIVPRV